MNARDRHRDIHSSQTKVSPVSAGAASEGLTTNLGSLRSRIGEKEAPPSSSYRGESSRNDDDRESSRKRTASDRDNDPTPGASESTSQAPKRPRLTGGTRGRPLANTHAIAKKLLPIDPSAGDKSQRRQD